MANPTSNDVSKGYIGSIFTALVLTSDASTYTHVIRPISTANGGQFQGVYCATELSAIFANILGFKQSSLVQPGSFVLAYLADPSLAIILGTIPDTDTPAFYPARTIIGVGDAINDAANRQPTYATSSAQAFRFNNRRPTDVVDGEYVVGNELGVMLGLFQQLATLRASELSQVQCHFLDDLVRIVSHNFEHYTSMGEFKIYHDGKSLLAEFGATHIPAESYGSPQITSDAITSPQFQTGAQLPLADDKVDFFTQPLERQVAIERMKMFIGRLGDFVRIIFTVPEPEANRQVDGKQISTGLFDTGIADFHVGTDGGIHIRSAKEVFIEKTNWIRVPQRVTTPDDPTGDDASAITYPVKEDFKWDISQSNQGNPYFFALQLRDYVAYMMSDAQAFANFKAHAKDFSVPSKPLAADILPEISQVDEHTLVNNSNYALRKAGIYMMPNGGITIKDAWDSAIIMEGGNIYLQASKDVVFQPMRNLIAKVGDHVSIAAQEDIDLSSTNAGFRLKTNFAQYFYSDTSGMIFEANSVDALDVPPTDPTAVVQGVAGILFKINKTGSFVVSSPNDVQFFATQGSFVVESDNISTTTTGETLIQAQGIATIDGGEGAFISSSSTASLTSSNSVILGGVGSTYIGQPGQNLNIVAMFGPNTPLPIQAVALDQSPIQEINTAVNSLVGDLGPSSLLAFFKTPAKVDAFKFQFLSSDEYALDQYDGLPDTLVNQGVIAGNGGFQTETWKETTVNSTLPFPGATAFDTYLFTSKAQNLTTYSENDLTEVAAVQNPGATLTKASLQTYQVSTT